jgi:predicted adenine nucleotide alpha hydrolase (AANH) superfamily ATPase
MKLVPPGKSILLHVCCAPCSGAIIEALCSQGFQPTVFWSNSNILSSAENSRRLAVLEPYAASFGVPVVVDPYDHADWLEKVARGFEDAPERCARCARCFRYNLAKAAEWARAHGMEAFTTSLTVSPHKPSAVVFAAGREAASAGPVAFLEEDFKKKEGFKLSVARSKELGLYRQSYCGCEFSKRPVTCAVRAACSE